MERYKHGSTRRGFIKLHVAVDIKTNKIVGFVIGKEDSHDINHYNALLEQAQKHEYVSKVLADGAYDSATVFEDAYYNGIVAAIPVRKNSRCDTSSYPRRIAVLIQKNSYQTWKEISEYGKRWILESAFSAIKRMFGESVMAHKKENMLHEMALKVMLYNRMVWVP